MRITEPDVQIPLPFDVDRAREVPSAPPHAAHASPAATPSEPKPAWLFVRHPRARRYVLRVGADGAVRVTIPRWGSKREAAAFADSQRAWIEKARARAAARLEDERARPRWSPEEVRDLRARAIRELPARLLEIAADLGLSVARVSVRNQRWRWGSCSRSGRICVNWRLVLVPCEVRDYVLVHELMHLKRMDHSRRFWTLVARACPDYRRLRRALREHEYLLDR